MTNNKFIDIVFDGPPAPESGRFVEVEDEHGSSVSVGDWVERDDGYWALRIRRDENVAELIELSERVQELEVEKTKIPILREALKGSEEARLAGEQKLAEVQRERDEAAALSHTYRNALEVERKGQGRWPTESADALQDGVYGPRTAYALAQVWSGWSRMSPEERSAWLSRHPYNAFEHAFVELKLSPLDALLWSAGRGREAAEL